MYPPLYKHYQGRVFVEKSMAIPDQSYSVKDLLRRFTTGTAPAIAKQAFYQDEPDLDNPLPTLSELDLAEIQELATSNYHKINDLKSKFNQQIKEHHEQQQQQQQPQQAEQN